MKPDWKNAPKWAKWLAMDATGTWYWYRKKPSFDGAIWWHDDEEAQQALVNYKDAAETLEGRPK